MTLGESMLKSDEDLGAVIVSLAYASYKAQREYGMDKDKAFRLFAPGYGDDTVKAWEAMYEG